MTLFGLELFSLAFVTAVLQIVTVDVLLGGDNAVVIALACRKLSQQQRRRGILWGVLGAIALRILLIFFALQLLALPGLKIAGALLLLWIGTRLLLPEEGEAHGDIAASSHLLGAIKTIIVADAVMSMDNVIAVAGAARGELGLVALGIMISIPIIVWGSQLVLRLMDRFPLVITLGAGLLGWIAGDMLLGDVLLRSWLPPLPDWLRYLSGAGGALLVMSLGHVLGQIQLRQREARSIHEVPLDGDEAPRDSTGKGPT
ncbi:TerC family protein [Vogesella sp. LIG4]|uniref:TerC family protein n=1 Tax=Vogesella sp. LIG4 TaxID=1192162 RepID=UPI00081F7869|nr:TerC family protein [Vogesella sp. LIG4]SCK19223.1 integral membrane protein, YjbE family [Vogesella sp. LIG4]